MAGKGRRFELSLKNNINENTPDRVKAHRPDFSGNSKGEVADVMVVWKDCGHRVHVDYIELKKTSGVKEGNRKVVISGSSQGENGMDELRGLIDGSPPWSRQWVAIKFQNRELIVLEASSLLDDLEAFGSDLAQPRPHGVRKTDEADNISMVKPTLDDWPSSTAGRDDYQKLLDVVGIE